MKKNSVINHERYNSNFLKYYLEYMIHCCYNLPLFRIIDTIIVCGQFPTY